MDSPSTALAPRKPFARSKVSNGTALVEGIDGRSREARRLHDIIAELIGDLGASPTPTEHLQIRTIAGLVLHVEQLTASQCRGEPVDTEQLTRAANAAARLLNALRRRARPKGRGVRDQLLAKYAETPA
jgi:hypothetical protein